MRSLSIFCVLFFAAVFCAAAEMLMLPGASLKESQRAVFDEYRRILGNDDPNVDFFDVGMEQLTEAAKLLRESDKLFPKSDKKAREDYLLLLIQTVSLTSSKSKDPKEKNALLNECMKYARQLPDPEFRSDVIKQIQEMRRNQNIDLDRIQTVEETLQLKNREWRNDHLSSLAQQWARQTPPRFDDAVRAAQAIGDEDVGTRELCFSIIAVRQARAKLHDDAEKTYRFITKSIFDKIETLASFVVALDEQGEPDAARQRIDELFVHADQVRKEDGNAFESQFYRYCYSALVRLKDAELAKYLFGKMVGLHDKRRADNARILDEFKSGKRTQHHIDNRCDLEDALTLAKAATRLGDRDAAQRYFTEARSVVADMDAEQASAPWQRHAELMVALFDAGRNDEAGTELQWLLDGNWLGDALYNIVSMLARHDHFAEACSVAKTISNENERTAACDEIVSLVRQRLRNDDDCRVNPLPPKKRFDSPQEVLAIADALSDTPDGKSLEYYRGKLRKLADYAAAPK